MFGPSGLSALIVTLHPGILVAAALGALLGTAALLLLMAAAGVKRRAWLGVAFFVGATLAGHWVISRLADLTPVDVEVVSIGGNGAAEE